MRNCERRDRIREYVRRGDDWYPARRVRYLTHSFFPAAESVLSNRSRAPCCRRFPRPVGRIRHGALRSAPLWQAAFVLCFFCAPNSTVLVPALGQITNSCLLWRRIYDVVLIRRRGLRPSRLLLARQGHNKNLYYLRAALPDIFKYLPSRFSVRRDIAVSDGPSR